MKGKFPQVYAMEKNFHYFQTMFPNWTQQRFLHKRTVVSGIESAMWMPWKMDCRIYVINSYVSESYKK